MAYPQFGYTACPTVASTLTSSQLLMSGSIGGSGGTAASGTTQTSVSTSCCETGRPIMTDPNTGQTVCSCQYSPSLLSYPRVTALPDTVGYSAAYAAQGYMPFGTDPSAFYSPLNPAYDLKDGTEAWRSLAHPTPCYPYDPTMAAGYPYGQSALAQRKNATREATSTLKAWLQEHIKNPYPTKGEKIMLAIITKMTLTQVSTWFANARRRLKKENKMTWSPRNRTDEDGNKIDSDDEGDGDETNNNDEKTGEKSDKKEDDDDEIIDAVSDEPVNVCGDDTASDILGSDSKPELSDCSRRDEGLSLAGFRGLAESHRPGMPTTHHAATTSPGLASPSNPTCLSPRTPSDSNKPKIWSLADVATSHNPGNAPGIGPAGLIRPTPTGLPTHPLAQKMVDSAGYNPSINGFRPWVNGSNGYINTSPSSTTSTGSGSSGLLRPYSLTSRTEVH